MKPCASRVEILLVDSTYPANGDTIVEMHVFPVLDRPNLLCGFEAASHVGESSFMTTSLAALQYQLSYEVAYQS